MVCPQCRGEFVPGVTRCPDCGVTLVDRLPDDKADDPQAASERRRSASQGDPPELVTILRTGDPGLIAVVKSLLQSADIPFLVPGEGIQDLAGLGRLGGYNIIFGPTEIQVRAQDADDARALLEQIESDELVSDDDRLDSTDDAGGAVRDDTGPADDETDPAGDEAGPAG